MPAAHRRNPITLRAGIVLACTLLSVCGAIVAVGRLQASATDGRDAELELTALRLDLAQIQDVPWGAAPEEADDPAAVREELKDAETVIRRSLAALSRDGGLAEERAIVVPFDRSMTALWTLFDLISHGKQDQTSAPSSEAAHQAAIADQALQKAAKRHRANSVRALDVSRTGSAAVILLLFGAFAWFYARVTKARRIAAALAAEKRTLLAASQKEALTDALTGLGNRRALIAELESRRPGAEGAQLALVLFDLDGFKQYNDNFGHPAGDGLLARLGERLAMTVDGIGSAYRIGGDEFCIVAAAPEGGAQAIAGLAAAALSDDGIGFQIGCSYGIALMPADTTEADLALLLADQRMYAHKTSGRISPSRQSADVLLTLLAERSSDLGQHTSDVASLAELTAARLGLAPQEIERIRLAAELHDVGKAAIPDLILNKSGELDADEWEFIRSHSVVGERIVRAAPSLAHTADLVRWHHERHDGSGYPDALRAEAIPIGARIIAVSDAFDAMVTDRPYGEGVPVATALGELHRCAGTQFDPIVVSAFAAVMAERVGSPA